DRVLAGIAQNLQAGLRNGDALVRFGGEEFLVLLPATGLGEAARLAESLWRRVASLGCDPLAPAQVTISVGVCALAQLERRSVEALIEGADRALYAAKNGGRNRVIVHTGSAAAPAPRTTH